MLPLWIYTSLLTSLGITQRAGLRVTYPLDKGIPLLIAFPKHFERSLHDCYTFSGISYRYSGISTDQFLSYISYIIKGTYLYLESIQYEYFIQNQSYDSKYRSILLLSPSPSSYLFF